ncbi:MAG: hypothetical protein LUG85_04900 [Clostridiales bacterium]|nr:hypothetical protein [Clostridiales bacterium]
MSDTREVTVRKAEKKDAPRLVELLHTMAEMHHEGRPDFSSAAQNTPLRTLKRK